MTLNFTNSSLISHTHISPHRNSPRNQPITKITVHHAAGNITLRALGEWLDRPTTRASYNYGIESLGNVGMFVEERDRCWGSSSRENDHQAVVIGVANITGAPQWRVSDAAWEMLVRLCVDICERNPGITQIDGLAGLWYDGTHRGSLTRHNMFSNQVCPGPYLQSRFSELVETVNNILNPSEVSEMRYNKVDEMPLWAQPTIQMLVEKGVLRGHGANNLDLSMDMIRIYVTNYRAGLYDKLFGKINS